MKMTANVIKNFLSKSSTRLYPFQVREPFDLCRYELYNDIDNCIFCGICQLKCPSQCITVDKKAGTWECDPFTCIFCSICVEACPTKSLHQKKTYRAPSAERQMIKMQGTPPAPKKKAKAEAAEAPKAKAENAETPKAKAKEVEAPKAEDAGAPKEKAKDAETPKAKKASEKE